jgi:hypothetical protein
MHRTDLLACLATATLLSAGGCGQDNAGPARQYMAELSGSLISFVHDPDSIIDHQFGVSIGAYGSTSGNIELLPELGMPLTVTVRHEPPRR